MFIKYADKAWEIASAVLAPPLLGLAAGHFLDQRLGTEYFTVGLLVLGILSGLWALVKIIRKTTENLIE
ncbi:MAG: AtpZ/AtpI family protein [Candidatus Margulisiibacteriota bacterium]